MQDEILKHTKKIYKTAKDKKHTFKEKIVEIIIEILIIVFAVSLSIWLHSWSEHNHQQKEVSVFLGNLKNDLQNDIKLMNEVKGEYQKMNLGYEKILALTSRQLDSIGKSNAKVFFPVNAQGRKLNDANYESFKSSGKMGYIEDEKLKQKILTYYQQYAPTLHEVDEVYNDYLFKFFDKRIENADKSEAQLYSDPKFKAAISFIVKIGDNNIRVYDKNVKPQAVKLIKEIEKEMDK